MHHLVPQITGHYTCQLHSLRLVLVEFIFLVSVPVHLQLIIQLLVGTITLPALFLALG